jgi:putative tricarboxylic transport membrane protein
VFGAPAITPAQRDALVNAVKTATASPAWKETLAKYGWEGVYLGGDEFKTFLNDDIKRINAIIDSLGLRK